MMQLSGEPGNDEAYDEAVVSHHIGTTTTTGVYVRDGVIELFAGKIFPSPHDKQQEAIVLETDSEGFRRYFSS